MAVRRRGKQRGTGESQGRVGGRGEEGEEDGGMEKVEGGGDGDRKNERPRGGTKDGGGGREGMGQQLLLMVIIASISWYGCLGNSVWAVAVATRERRLLGGGRRCWWFWGEGVESERGPMVKRVHFIKEQRWRDDAGKMAGQSDGWGGGWRWWWLCSAGV